MTSLGRGVFVPVPTFFKENEDVDLNSFDQHIKYLANTGISGIVVLGSMGEAVHLSEKERGLVIEQGFKSIQRYNPELKLIAGTSGQSVRVTLGYIKQAKEFGAEFCLVLPPSFYRGAINDEAIVKFYKEVADRSELPVVIYNYPGVCQGVDLSVEVLVELAKHKNIVGVKGTDGNVGKMANLVNKTNPKEITLLAGSADFFLPELIVGVVGLIPGAGNLLPSLCVRVQKFFEQGKIKEASELQSKLVEADDALCRWFGIAGTKSYIQSRLGYGGGICRSPLGIASKEDAISVERVVDQVWELEQGLHLK